MCSGTTLLPVTQNDKGIHTHADYMGARARLDELKAIEEPATHENQEKRRLAVMIWIYEQRTAAR